MRQFHLQFFALFVAMSAGCAVQPPAAVRALVLGASGLLIGAVSGSGGVALACLLTVFGSVMMRLFESKSKWSKALAIFMLPALLLTYLKPKKKPSSERDRP